jgi:hypothetical protein
LIYYILKDFLHVYEAIKVVINSSKLKAFKNKSLVLTNIEIIYLNIILIFVKATIKLQAENHPTIYHIVPKVYKIYNKLENFKKSFKVSNFF